MSIALVTASWKGVDRVRFLLKSIMRNDPEPFVDGGIPIIVVEDYSGDAKQSADFDLLKDEFPYLRVQVDHLTEWGCIQGAVERGFDLAIQRYEPEWIVFLSDDTAVTPNAITNMLHFLTENDLKTVGLVGFPYWNSQDLMEGGSPEWGHEPRLLKHRNDFYKSLDWLDNVKVNPHWEHLDKSGARSILGRDVVGDSAVYALSSPGCAFPYVNVHGTGFACHVPTFKSVGGFYPETWRFDEGIAYKVWTQSDRGVVALPGPTIAHYGAGTSTLSEGLPETDAGDAVVWKEVVGKSVKECDNLIREQMHVKGAAICAEMRSASYWRAK